MKRACGKCGKVAKAPGHMKAEGGQIVCISAAACKKRRDRQPQYRDWSSPSFEQQMST